jgi:AmpD protein
MQIDTNNGLLIGAEYIASPNFDERPPGMAIDLLVIHNISLPKGVFGTNAITELFCNKLDIISHQDFMPLVGLKVSAHLLIRRDGSIIQYVPFTKRAWHAGNSQFNGRENCNDFSIGIELEGTDDIPYEEIQYKQLALISGLLMQVYPKITLGRVVGHSDIAPTRKTDPGPAFLWEKYKNMVQKAETTI